MTKEENNKKEWFEEVDWDIASVVVCAIGGILLLAYGVICTYYL